jgi:hypothetical protein
MSLAARVSTIVAIAAAVALALRALLGPYAVAGARVASPMGLESVFACAFLAALLLAPESKPAGAGFRLPLAAALALVALAYVPNLRDPFLSDDYILATRATISAALPAVTTPGGDGSFRPLGYLYFGLLRAVFGPNSFAWHIVALAIHLANSALLYFIVKTLWDRPPIPALAALFFGLHGTRPEAVVWSAGNFDLLACGFTFAATLCALRRRALAAAALAALAILSKESAYAAPLVILGFAAAGGKLREARNAIFAVTGVCLALFIYRWTLFHGPGGYIDPATGQAQVLSFHLGSALKGLLLRVWALMLVPLNWDSFARSWMADAALLCLALAMPFLTPPSRRVTVALLATTVVALLPAYHLALIGQDLNGSRILYLPAAGFCVLGAHLVYSRRIAAAAFLIAAALMLRVNLNAWHENAVLADQVCAGTTSQPPVHDRLGIVFFANGYKECLTLKGR